jgi:hypothetical protein
LVVLASAIGGIYFLGMRDRDASSVFWPELRAAPTSALEVAVGRNVPISQAREVHAHMESVIAADPKDPKRLFAAAMFWRQGVDSSLAGYYSHDGGATWHVGFEADPAAAGERSMTFACGPRSMAARRGGRAQR